MILLDFLSQDVSFQVHGDSRLIAVLFPPFPKLARPFNRPMKYQILGALPVQDSKDLYVRLGSQKYLANPEGPANLPTLILGTKALYAFSTVDREALDGLDIWQMPQPEDSN